MTDKLKPTNLELTQFDKGSTKAFATITFNNTIRINGLRVVDGRNGLFVSWPSRKVDDSKWQPFITFDENALDLRDKINSWIIEQYEKGNFTKSSGSTEQPQPQPQPQPRPQSQPQPQPQVVTKPEQATASDDDLPF